MKSTMGGRVDISTVEEVWNVIEEHKKHVAPVVVSNNQNGDKNEQNIQKDSNKRKSIESKETENTSNKKSKLEAVPDQKENNENNNSIDIVASFQMEAEILKVLNKKESISLTKLQKKILKKYKAFKGEEVQLEKFYKRVNKKLNKIDNVEIEGDIVSIKK